MNNTIKFLIPKNSNSERLDVYLSKRMKSYQNFIKKLIKQKNVDVNGISNVVPSTKIKKMIRLLLKLLTREIKLVPKKIDLKIVYEDSDILVINKPKGMVVHPGAGNYENTLANGLAFKYKKFIK